MIQPIDQAGVLARDLVDPRLQEQTVVQEYCFEPLHRLVQLPEEFPESFWETAESLGANEAIWLDVRVVGDAQNSLALSAGASHTCGEPQEAIDVFADRSAEIRGALQFTFPGFSIVDRSYAAPSFARSSVIPLRGVPVLLPDLSGRVDPDLLLDVPRAVSDGRPVVLGACALDASFARAIHALQAMRTPALLRLTFRNRQLRSPDLRVLTETYRNLAELRGSHLLTAEEISRINGMSSWVMQWLSAKSGVELSATISSDSPARPALVRELSTALSLPPSARREAAHSDLDLSGCFVRGQTRLPLSLNRSGKNGFRFIGSIDLSSLDSEYLAYLGTTPEGASVSLSDRSRSRHTVVCGATGTGKSTALRALIADDIRRGYSVILIDPHGDLYNDVLEDVSLAPDCPVWLANTADLENPYTLNLFQSAGDTYRQNFVCNQLIRLMKRSLYKDVPEGFGPMFEAYFRNAFLLLSSCGDGSHTISDMDHVFGNASFRRSLLEKCEDQHVRRFWREIASRAGGEASLENIAPYIVSKLTQFIGNPVIRPIVSTSSSTIDFNEVLEKGGVCLINLAKGKVGSTEAEILGSLFTTAIFSAALATGDRRPEARKTTRVYLDEFQSYAGEIIGDMLAECRKYGLEMTLATQSLNRLQGMNGDLANSILGNVGNIVAMRSGPHDSYLLSDWIGGGVTREDIMCLDDFRSIGRFLENGRVTEPIYFSPELVKPRTANWTGRNSCRARNTHLEIPF